jgi:hypothetical protein
VLLHEIVSSMSTLFVSAKLVLLCPLILFRDIPIFVYLC